MTSLDKHARYGMDGSYDVSEKISIDRYIGSFTEDMHALVYAAGANYLDWSQDIDTMDRMRYLYDVNCIGLIRCLQLRPEIEKCVVIGSDAATRPMRTSVAYNASKAALNAAVKCIARERARELQINIVSPGLISEGQMTAYVYDRTKELRPDLDLESYMLGGIPMGRPGYAVEVAEVVRWLLEDAPAYLNGSIIEVNGAR